MPNALIKCSKCNEDGYVPSSDLNKTQLTYHCNDCNNDFQIEFFDCCPKCHINVGFIDAGNFTDDMKDVGSRILKSIFSPGKSLLQLANDTKDIFIGNTKDANGDGKCPFCKTRFLRCPSCNELFEIPNKAIWTDRLKCKHCGQVVAPCSVGKNPSKHSKEFYRH